MNSNFDYKKYSLEKLQEWVHDALSTCEASPHEIYSTIREAVREDYYYYKDHCSRAYGLLALLNGERPSKDESINYTTTKEKFSLVCDKDNKSPECQDAWNDFWEENYYPEEYYPHPNQKQYTEEELSAMCEQAASEAEKQKCREYNLREAEYYDKRAKLDAEYDKVKKWVLLVEETKISETDEIEYFVSFPDDLLEAANLKEGDQVEWVDKGDGTWMIHKVTKTLGMDEC